MEEVPIKKYPTIACCGLDCGLCPRYYTVGASRCPGCCGPDFFNKHPSCSYVTCCVKKKGLEVCPQCIEFPCDKFKALLLDDGGYDSFLTYKKVNRNLNFIKKYGVEKFLEEQRKRINLLLIMLNNFNDGRSKSFYCIATTLLSLKNIKKALDQTNQKVKDNLILKNDGKTKARILKGFLNNVASKEGIELKLRKKPKE
jgi:hypothetical protein